MWDILFTAGAALLGGLLGYGIAELISRYLDKAIEWFNQAWNGIQRVKRAVGILIMKGKRLYKRFVALLNDEEIEEYEDFNNPVKGFFRECNEQDGADYIFRETATAIYKRYQVYCAENNFQPESNTVFGRTLKSLFGVESKQKKINGKNVRMYVKVAESSE